MTKVVSAGRSRNPARWRSWYRSDAARQPFRGLGAPMGRNRAVVRARERYPGSLAEAFVGRLRDLHFVTTITLFGSAFLLSALPFMILLSSFANRRIEQGLSQHLGLDARAAQIVGRLFQTTPVHVTGPVVIAVLLTLAGTLGVAGSVRNVYEQVFGQSHRGGVLRLLVWVGALCGWLALDGILSSVTRGVAAGGVADVVGILAGTTLFFWWSMHLLLAGRVRWRALLLPAGITALFWLGLQVFAALYFSVTITNDSRLYGVVGVIFSLLTWFMAVAGVIVLGAAAGAAWQERRATRPFRRAGRTDAAPAGGGGPASPPAPPADVPDAAGVER